MKKGLVFSRGIWCALSIAGVWGFSAHLDSIAWLMAFLASAVPLFVSLISSNKALDRAFLSILVVSLQSVAVAVSWAQWFILDASSLHVVWIPALSLLFWGIHERVTRVKTS